MRLIDADSLKEDLTRFYDGEVTARQLIDEQPTVEPVKGRMSDKDDCINRQWLMECVSEGWIKFDTKKDENIFMHLVRDIAPSVQPEQNAQDEDLISRKAAIEALARMMPRSYTSDGSHPADEEIFRAQEVFADCIEALEILPSAAPSTAHTTETTAETTAPSTDDWVPVKKRLPAVPWCRCLITRDDGRGRATVKEALFSFSRWYDNEWLGDGRNRKFNISESVIAWAPFPAPYRGGGT